MGLAFLGSLLGSNAAAGVRRHLGLGYGQSLERPRHGLFVKKAADEKRQILKRNRVFPDQGIGRPRERGAAMILIDAVECEEPEYFCLG